MDRERLLHGARNNALWDLWSIAHVLSGIAFGWIMDPFIGLVILILWEPLEIFVLSPLAAKVGKEFGYESWRNAMSDILFDAAGVAIGYYGLRALAAPPFTLF